MDRENQGIIARKYATAFIHLFSNNLELQIPEDIDHLKIFMSYLNSHRKSLFYADLKLLSVQTRQQILHNLVDRFGLNSAFKKLTDLLVLHQRVFMLHDIVRFIINLYLDKNNIIPFIVFSSHKISAAQEKALIKFLELKSNKKVVITSQLDTSLIAGLKAISADLEWEHSIRKKLSLLDQT